MIGKEIGLITVITPRLKKIEGLWQIVEKIGGKKEGVKAEMKIKRKGGGEKTETCQAKNQNMKGRRENWKGYEADEQKKRKKQRKKKERKKDRKKEKSSVNLSCG